MTNPLQSAGRRFVQKFGVAFLWATFIGLGLGAAVFYRVDRRDFDGDPAWHALPRIWLESLELRTVDWRARALGADAERPDDVVLVNIDEETLNNARESERLDWAMRPWPRELLGSVVEQLIREGAIRVYVDGSFVDVSPRQLAVCKGEAPRSDDVLFAQTLAKLGDAVVLPFEWHRDNRRPPDRPLMPFLLRVGDVAARADAWPLLRRVLMERTSAYLFEKDGRFEVWAGAVSDARRRELASTFELKGALVTRGLTPDDDANEVLSDDLLRDLAAVEVKGLPQEELIHAGSIDAPVAPLVLPELGLANARLLRDPDGVVRSVPLVVWSKKLLPTFALASREGPFTWEKGVLTAPEGPPIPVDAQGFLTLRWSADEAGRTGRGTMKRAIPAWRLLVNREDDDSGRGVRHYDNNLTGRVVVLVDERGTQRFPTAVGDMTRGAIWAQAISNAMKGQGITRVAPETDFWATLALAFTGAILAVAWSSLTRRPGWLAWATTIALVVGVQALLARQLYVTQGRQVAMVAPVLACAATFLASLGYARTLEKNIREFMLRTLGGAVRADVVRRVERDLALMQPERRELTVFFSDIEGFTAVSNEKEPRLVVEVLRHYLEEMTEIVLDRGGHVDKYLGDGLMAFWGAPVMAPDDAESACEAALRMHARFQERAKAWSEKTGRRLILRAGMETGDAVVGEMGTAHRVNYTVMGEPVATAFRLEALAKKYGVSTLCGEAIFEEAKDTYLFRSVDVVRLGRTGEPVHLYELLAPLEHAERFGWALPHELAWTAWRERRFAEALTAFRELQKQLPDDEVIALYVRRCEKALQSPPPKDWNGIVDD
ncbi:MAG: CHASE2 domain-containing protein [Archangium sp.]